MAKPSMFYDLLLVPKPPQSIGLCGSE